LIRIITKGENTLTVYLSKLSFRFYVITHSRKLSMKKLRVWHKVLILLFCLFVFNASVYFYILWSGPFESAVNAYKSEFIEVQSQEISLCFLCRKRFSYGNGRWKYTFTIDVQHNGLNKKVPVTCQTVKGHKACDVKFL
jgi:hypothetical protein